MLFLNDICFDLSHVDGILLLYCPWCSLIMKQQDWSGVVKEAVVRVAQCCRKDVMSGQK